MGYPQAGGSAGSILSTPGVDGKSAFEIAQDSGFVGTVEEWINVSENLAGIIHLSLFTVAPAGFLICDGSLLNRTIYSRLFAAIGTMFGAGDGSTTFRIPDLRGRFPRFTALGSTNDPDRATRTDRGDGTVGDAVGTLQGHMVGPHTHDVPMAGSGTGNRPVRGNIFSGAYAIVDNPAGSTETRSINIYLTGLIKI